MLFCFLDKPVDLIAILISQVENKIGKLHELAINRVGLLYAS
jgi:hypothetical protein